MVHVIHVYDSFFPQTIVDWSTWLTHPTLIGMGCHTEQHTKKKFQAIFFLSLVSPRHVLTILNGIKHCLHFIYIFFYTCTIIIHDDTWLYLMIFDDTG